jgi:hypothetical protein
VNGKYSTSEDEWKNIRSVKAGDELFVLVYIDNGAANNLPLAQTLARSVKVKTSIDTSVGTNHTVSVSFGGDNTNTVSKSLTVRTAANEFLEVVPNSGELFDSYSHLIQSGLLVGNRITNLGDIAPGFETDLFLRFKIRVRGLDGQVNKPEDSRVTRVLNKGLEANCPTPPSVATLNPFPLTFASPPETCRNYPPLDLQIDKFSQSEAELDSEHAAKPGDEFLAEIYIDNGAADNLPLAQTLARNVQVRTFVDASVGLRHKVTVSFAGNNTNTVSKTLIVRTPTAARLEIVPNSGEIFDFQRVLLKDNFQLGNNSYAIGDLGPGFDKDLFLRFKIRVQSADSLTYIRRSDEEQSRLSLSFNKGQGTHCPNPPEKATLNPFSITFQSPAEFCKNYAPIDVRFATETGQYSQNEDDWEDGIKAKDGDELYVLSYIDNGAANSLPLSVTTARNVKVTSTVETKVGSTHMVSVSFAGENTNTVSASFPIYTEPNSFIEVVPNTGQIRNFTATEIKSDRFQFGNNTIEVGDIAPGFETDLFVRFMIRVRTMGDQGSSQPQYEENARVTLSSNKGLTKHCLNPPPVATLNPFPLTFTAPAESCHNYPALDLRFIGGSYSRNEDEWNRGRTARVGDQIYALVYLDNGAANDLPLSKTLAKNVKVTSVVDTTTGPEHQVTISFAGDNTNVVTKTLTIRTAANEFLEIVGNSGGLFNNKGRPLKTNLQVGNNTYLVGDIAPGFKTDLFLRFLIEVKSATHK